jgi:branched-chain amino acid transport system ATP-binding protein
MTDREVPLLKVEGLSASYGHIQALKPTSIEIWPGELVAVLGPNGAGKSTLLKAILRMVRASKGEIVFDGRSITGLSTHQLPGLGIAFVPEGRGILGPLTVRENLDLGAYSRFGRVPAAEIEDDLRAVFKLFPRLEEREFQSGGSLSGGEQQMLAVGRAMMTRPRLLLLDEPSLGLAPRVATEIFQALGDLNRKGLTILLVEQKAPLALKMANRAYVLRNGKVVTTAMPEEINSPEALSRLYLGHIE